MSDKSKDIKEKFANMMELPKELIMNIPRLTILGNEDLFVENYNGICEYEENVIKLNCKITIWGECLNIEEITDSEIMITGKISDIEFNG